MKPPQQSSRTECPLHCRRLKQTCLGRNQNHVPPEKSRTARASCCNDFAGASEVTRALTTNVQQALVWRAHMHMHLQHAPKCIWNAPGHRANWHRWWTMRKEHTNTSAAQCQLKSQVHSVSQPPRCPPPCNAAATAASPAQPSRPSPVSSRSPHHNISLAAQPTKPIHNKSTPALLPTSKQPATTCTADMQLQPSQLVGASTQLELKPKAAAQNWSKTGSPFPLADDCTKAKGCGTIVEPAMLLQCTRLLLGAATVPSNYKQKTPQPRRCCTPAAQFSPGSMVSSPGPILQAAPVMPMRCPTHSFSFTSSSSVAWIFLRSQSSMMKSSHTS